MLVYYDLGGDLVGAQVAGVERSNLPLRSKTASSPRKTELRALNLMQNLPTTLQMGAVEALPVV